MTETFISQTGKIPVLEPYAFVKQFGEGVAMRNDKTTVRHWLGCLKRLLTICILTSEIVPQKQTYKNYQTTAKGG